jgi:hypothetical protein
MFFLLRMAFWLGVVCLLLPGSGPRANAPDAKINATEAVTAASAAMSDARGFCERQPNACAVGGKVASAIGYRAEAGARTLYRFIASQFGGTTSTPAPKATAQVTAVSTHDRGTLTDADLVPAWHARVPLPPRREVPAARPSA